MAHESDQTDIQTDKSPKYMSGHPIPHYYTDRVTWDMHVQVGHA